MACLFGLGLGMALGSSRKDISRWFPLGVLAIVAIICFAGPMNLTHVTFINPLENYLIGSFVNNLGAEDTPMRRLQLFLPGLALLVGVFYLLVFTFACLGQRLGVLFCQFKPLTAYSINVFAALAGILLFTLVSYMSLNPVWWITIGAWTIVLCYFRWDQIAALAAALIIAFTTAEKGVRWSPYYRISIAKIEVPKDGNSPAYQYGYNINVNYDTIEGAYNNNPEKIAALTPEQKKHTADYYDTPYQALGDKPRDILVLAAGTGNDVAAALRHGAEHVDCIEIDPMIAKIGKELHPENPYSNPKVDVIVDDARAFIKKTDKKYDLIVFAYLDSHSAFSAMSSLRLDNYVYTKDCFADASKLLKPGGTMSVTFYYLTWWQLTRVWQSLKEGFGQEPLGVYSMMNNGPTLLVGAVNKEQVEKSGLPMFSIDKFLQENNATRAEWDQVEPTTDDWPFLFLKNRSISWTYAIGLIFTLYLGIWLVRRCFGTYVKDKDGITMFFLGAAFMLIETKSVTQMGLLAGTTWIVNSAVIGGVLVMILVANLIQIQCQFKNVKPLYAMLFLALLFSYFFPLSIVNTLDASMRLPVGALILVAPLFFASFIFAITYNTVKDPDKALGMNLLGTLIGGALEYFSMMIGVNALGIVAALLYLCAFLSHNRKSPETKSDTAIEASSGSESSTEKSSEPSN